MKINLFSRSKKSRPGNDVRSRTGRQQPGRLGSGRLGIEQLEDRRLLAIDGPSTAFRPTDVNHDGITSPLDLLAVINDLNSHGIHSVVGTSAASSVRAAALPSGLAAAPNLALDVNQDGLVSPLDSLVIVNALNDVDPALVRIRVAATDTSGNEIASIGVGQNFQLRVFVKDLRTTGSSFGVFSAYTDVQYNSTLASVTGNVLVDGTYPAAQTGDDSQPGLIDEAGGSRDSATALGTAERLLFTVPMHADAAGSFNFVALPASGLGSVISVYGQDTAVSTDQVDYGVPATLTIIGAAGLSVADISQNEGNSGSTPFTFEVTLSQVSATPVSVTYATGGGTAIAGTDYQAATDVVTFNPGETSKLVTINGIPNTTPQPNRTFQLTLSGATGGVDINRATATATIVDDDGSQTFSITGSVSHPEGNSGTTTYVYTVSLFGVIGGPASVDFTTVNGTATAGSDYNTSAGTLTFNPGDTAKTITVTAKGDTTYEADENFSVTLSNPTGGTAVSAAQGTGIGTIANDDSPPAISLLGGQVTAPASGTVPLSFSVDLPQASGLPVTVHYTTQPGTATSDDFEPISGDLSFAPGETHKTVTVNVKANASQSANVSFLVVLSGAAGATLGTSQATGVILVPGAKLATVRLTVTDLLGNPISTISEQGNFLLNAFVQDVTGSGNAGGVFEAYTDITFAAALAAATGPVTFGEPYSNGQNFNLSQAGQINDIGAFDGLAPLGTSEQLLFSVQMQATAPGSLNFVSNFDTNHEFLLYGPDAPLTASEIDFGSTSLTVNALPGFSIENASHKEENSGAQPQYQFKVTLSKPVTQTTTVNFATSNGSALQSVDYTSNNGQLIFQPGGPLSQNIIVTGIGNIVPQPDRTFFVTLSGVSQGATILDPQATGTILDDDGSPTFSINNVTHLEGDTGTTLFTFTVSLNGYSTKDLSVNFATADGTAVAPTDYTSASGTLTFPPTQVSTATQSISISVNTNKTFGPDKTFYVNLSGATGGAVVGAGQGTGTIQNDDIQPSITIADQTINAPASGTIPMTFTLNLSAASELPAVVHFATQDKSAKAGQNYVATSGDVTFQPGQTEKTITVQVMANAAQTLDLTFAVNLTNVTGATLADDQAIGTIQPISIGKEARIRLGVTSDPEGLNPITTIKGGEIFYLVSYVKDIRTDVPDVSKGIFGAYLNVGFNAAQLQVVGPVSFAANYPNAQQDSLTLQHVGAVTDATTPFGAGEQRLFSVPVIATLTNGGTVQFAANPDPQLPQDAVLLFGSDDPVPLAAVQYLGTSINVTPASVLSVPDTSVTANTNSDFELIYTVSINPGSDKTVTLNYATADGTAVAGVNYTPTKGTLIFLPGGPLQQQIHVTVHGTSLSDANRTVLLNLSSAVNAVLARTTAIGTIINTNPAPVLSINNATATAGTDAFAQFQISLSQASARDITFVYATADGTAKAGVNYTAQGPATYTIKAGDTTAVVSIPIKLGQLDDIARTFFLNLSSPVGVTLSQVQAIGTIYAFQSSSISGAVYADLNKDNNFQANEFGLNGVPISLTGTDIFGNAVNRTLTTSSNGGYAFAGLVAGHYVLQLQQPPSLVFGGTHVGTQGGAITGPGQITIDLAAGVNGVNNVFSETGVQGNVTLSNIFFASSLNGRTG